MLSRCILCCSCILAAWNMNRAGVPEPSGLPLLRSGNPGSLDLIIGIRGGINFSHPFVLNQNEVIQGNDPSSPYEKDYATLLTNIGYQYAFMVLLPVNDKLSVSFEPSVASYNYRYKSSTVWANGADPTDYFTYAADHKNQVTYLEFPVVVRYAIAGKKIQPFLSLALTYGYRIGAAKKTETTVTRNTGSVSVPYENTTVIQNNSGSYIHSRLGIAPGIGFHYPLGPVILMLAADFNLGLNNVVDESQRYGNAAVTSGLYDVQDDLRLSALNINLGILFRTGMNQGGNSGGKRRGGKALECIPIPGKKK